MIKKIVLITGCSGGLGSLLAQNLSAKGYVVYAGIRKIEDVTAFLQRWGASHPNIHPIRLDITSDESCQEAVREVVSREGRLDVLINNAAYVLSGPTLDFTSGDYLSILDTNAVGGFRLMKLVVPQMRSQKSGRIVNITSMNGRIALPNFGLYSASKFALEALGLSLRYELEKSGISITNIAPGAIKRKDDGPGGQLHHVPARQKFWLIRKLMPLLSPSEVADVVARVLESPTPPAQVLVGRDAKITTFLQRFLPQFLWDKLMVLVWNR